MSEDEDEGGMLGDFFSKKTHRTPNFEVEAFGRRTISIAQESRMHLGGRVWGASVHMLRYFAHSIESSTACRDLSWHRPTLLELGAGTGLLGIGMALAPSPAPDRRVEVRLTDKADLLPQIEDNIRANLEEDEIGRVAAMELDWMRWEDASYWTQGGAGHRAAAGVEVVLAADCIYFASLYRPFIETLKQICHINSINAASGHRRIVCYLCNDDGRTAQNRTSTEPEQHQGTAPLALPWPHLFVDLCVSCVSCVLSVLRVSRSCSRSAVGRRVLPAAGGRLCLRAG
jgi:hypothetical protein